MVGFLAPEIGTLSSGVRGTAVGPADTTIGDALTGVANLINLVSSKGSGGGPTQKDRDNETLQGFSAEIALIQKLRGERGETVSNSKLNSAFKAFSAVNPVHIDAAKNIVLALTGIQIGGEKFSFKNQQQKANETFSLTARGRSALVRIHGNPQVRDSKTGEFIPEIAFALLSEEAALAAADTAMLEAISLQLQVLTGKDEIRSLLEQDVIRDMTLKFGKRSEATVAGLSAAAFHSGVKVADASALVGGLLREKQAAENEYFAEARLGGFADNPDFKVGLAAALQPFDTMITLIEDLGEEAIRAFNVFEATERTITAKMINKLLGVGGTNRDVVSYVVKAQIDRGVIELRTLQALDPSELRKILGNQPLFPGTATVISPESPPPPGSAMVPEIVERARTLTDQERVGELRTHIATFGLFTSDDEDSRATAVKAFGLAALTINTSLQELAEATFDQLYDTKFFDTYNTIVKHGDQNSADFQTAVTENLSIVLEQRLGIANIDIQNRFGNKLPGITLVSDGDKIIMHLGNDLTPLARGLTKALKKNDLPLTIDGMVDLVAADPFNPILDSLNIGLFAGRNVLGNLVREVAYVNKIIGVIKRLPDIAPHILPSIGIDIKLEEGGSVEVTQSRIVVVNKEDALTLSSGDRWEYTDERGDIHRGTKR